MRIAFEPITLVILVVLGASGCVSGPQVRMNSDLPIETEHGYRQNGEKLDEKHMIQVLSRKPASAGRIRLARSLGTLGNVFAAGAGGLVGWELGERAFGGEVNANVLYAAAGIAGASIALAIGSVLSVQGAVRAHNRAVGFKDTSEVPPPVVRSLSAPHVSEKGSLLVAQANVGDLTVTWLGDIDAANPRLGLRLQRPAAPAMLARCDLLDVRTDQQVLHLPIVYGTQSVDQRSTERVQATIDAESLRRIVDARTVQLRVCGFGRTLTADAVAEGRLLLETYQARLAQQRASQASVESSLPSGALEAVAPAGDAPTSSASAAAP